jgi:cobalt-zinc-cadmium resistance protein CzcA
LLPDINASVFQGTNNGPGTQKYSGFQVGLAIPVWFGNQKSKIAAAKTETSILEYESTNYKLQLASKYEALQSDLRYFEEGLTYYETTGKRLAEETLFHAIKAFQNGEINFLQYTQLLDNAKSIQSNYLFSLFQYNTTVLEANYLMN